MGTKRHSVTACLIAIACVAGCGGIAADDAPADDTGGDDGPPLGDHQAPPFTGTDPTDADLDGIADELEAYLVAQFAPELRLAPDENDWTRPANVDWYLARVHMRFDHPDCP